MPRLLLSQQSNSLYLNPLCPRFKQLLPSFPPLLQQPICIHGLGLVSPPPPTLLNESDWLLASPLPQSTKDPARAQAAVCWPLAPNPGSCNMMVHQPTPPTTLPAPGCQDTTLSRFTGPCMPNAPSLPVTTFFCLLCAPCECFPFFYSL